ncbi:MAG: glycoside hydrolase family 127 protein [Clostridia bacterium]|nr:glycoside hydrolase family 127 protein [Clostridia bacterium]
MKPIFNRAPLTPNTLSALTPGAIHPKGWLKDQLQKQYAGLSANLLTEVTEVTAENLESVAKRLDGLLLIARVMKDDAAVERAFGIAGMMLDYLETDDRRVGDISDLIYAMRTMRRYFVISGDKRTLKWMDRFFREQIIAMRTAYLSDRAVAMSTELIAHALWLYNITGQKHLIDLCFKLRSQSIDWVNVLHAFTNTMPMSRACKADRLQEGIREEIAGGERLEGENRPYFQSQNYITDGEMMALGLKAPGIINQFKSGFKEQNGFRFGWEKLMKAHGVANGLYTCDSRINGRNPAQGTDVVAVAELMHTLETLIEIGDPCEDLTAVLEKVAFNALPAAFNADMTRCRRCHTTNRTGKEDPARRYDLKDTAVRYTTDMPDSVHRAWPEFVSSLWMATEDDGLQAVSYAPCSVRHSVAGTPIKLKVSGGYPFSRTVRIEVAVKQPVEFPVYLPIPKGTRTPTIYLPDGEIMQVRSGEVTCVRRKWQTGDTVRLELPVAPYLTRWHHQSQAVEFGPLVMTCRADVTWNEIADGSVLPVTDDPMSVALVHDEPMKTVFDDERMSAFGAEEDAGVRILIRTVPIEWDHVSNGIPMQARALAGQSVMELVPYGDAALGITQFPIAIEHN